MPRAVPGRAARIGAERHSALNRRCDTEPQGPAMRCLPIGKDLRMKPIFVMTLCAVLGTAAAPASAQDMQDTIGRILQGFQGGQSQQQDQRGGAQRRGDERRPVYDDRSDPRDRMRMLDEADRRLDAQQRQLDEDRRRIEAERRSLSRQ
jgi:hypothetical protein